MPPIRRIAVAITGASGARYGLRVLQEIIRSPELEAHVIVSRAGAQVLEIEEGIRPGSKRFGPDAPGLTSAAHYHRNDDLTAPIASGSFYLDAMAIVPCSMGCAARIAHGISSNLIERAADVMIKERRRLVIVPRETPLSVIHLENLLTLARAGVTVLPAAPGFYGKPRSIENLVDFVAARVLDHLGVPHGFGPRWGIEEGE